MSIELSLPELRTAAERIISEKDISSNKANDLRILQIAAYCFPEIAIECDDYIQQMGIDSILALPNFSACGHSPDFEFLTSFVETRWPFTQVRPRHVWLAVKNQTPPAFTIQSLIDKIHDLVSLFRLYALSADELRDAMLSEISVFSGTDIKLRLSSDELSNDEIGLRFAEICSLLIDVIKIDPKSKNQMIEVAQSTCKAIGPIYGKDQIEKIRYT